ncbi:MAG: hypothetical protein GAK37_01689 [Pseudomonas sp.]|nr:MAG: hypothetical protein GAK37_01689 [Pseudomonas sp.]
MLFATGEQSGLVIKARAGMHGGAGDAFDMRLAQGALHKAGHAVALAGADERAQFVVGIALAGKPQAGDRRAQFGHELVVNPGLGIKAAGGGAVLASVVIAVGPHALDHRLQVGVVAHDHRGFAAQFQVGALDGLGRRLQDFLPGDDVAGQRHHAHLGVAHQVAAHAFTAAAHNVDHTAWQQLVQHWRQGQDRQRRVLRRLEHQRIACGQGRGDFPGSHHQRVIPRRDGRHHAHRIAPHHAGVARQVLATQLAGLATHGTGKKAEYVHRGAQVILARQVQRLAAVQRFQAGEVVGVFFHGIGDA